MNNFQKSIGLILCAFPVLLWAQSKDTTSATWRPMNLVINNSFEIPTDSNEVFKLANLTSKALGWTVPNKSKPKIYSTTPKGFIYDPSGSSWSFKARTGINVAGLEAFGNTRDYIQGSLTVPLVLGKKYYFAFWVHYHCTGANNIGIAFLPDKIKVDSSLRLPLKPATYQRNLVPYSNDAKSTWVLVRDSFVAHKPFQSFIIGNFFKDEETLLEKGRYNHFFAYIDDVAVWEARIQPTENLITETEKEDWQRNVAIVTPKNVVITLNDIYFDFNSAKLQSRSFPTLDSLVQKLRLVSTMKIHIMGHTSSEGTDDFNLKLSTNRAESVKNYLMAQGIESPRLSHEGLGETQLIVPNDTTEEDKKRNRRVVFIRVE